MADGVFNIAKGRVAELHERVNNSDPTNAALVVVLLASAGIGSDALLKDCATLAAVSIVADEATNTNYARKVLTDADISAIATDNTNDWNTADFADQTWSAVANDGTGAIGKLIVCYDSDSTGGADSAIIPLTYHDFVVTPNGGSITATVSDYFKAS